MSDGPDDWDPFGNDNFGFNDIENEIDFNFEDQIFSDASSTSMSSVSSFNSGTPFNNTPSFNSGPSFNSANSYRTEPLLQFPQQFSPQNPSFNSYIPVQQHFLTNGPPIKRLGFSQRFSNTGYNAQTPPI